MLQVLSTPSRSTGAYQATKQYRHNARQSEAVSEHIGREGKDDDLHVHMTLCSTQFTFEQAECATCRSKTNHARLQRRMVVPQELGLKDQRCQEGDTHACVQVARPSHQPQLCIHVSTLF